MAGLASIKHGIIPFSLNDSDTSVDVNVTLAGPKMKRTQYLVYF